MSVCDVTDLSNVFRLSMNIGSSDVFQLIYVQLSLISVVVFLHVRSVTSLT